MNEMVFRLLDCIVLTAYLQQPLHFVNKATQIRQDVLYTMNAIFFKLLDCIVLTAYLQQPLHFVNKATQTALFSYLKNNKIQVLNSHIKA
jgi:hypothetical protein